MITYVPRTAPRWLVATLVVALVSFGLPILLLAVDPGDPGPSVDSGSTSAAGVTVTVQVPEGWTETQGLQGATVLTKGGATIEITTRAFDGTAAALYGEFVDQLAGLTTVNSSSDPTPARLAGLEAVSGTVHFLLNGLDSTSWVVAGVEDGEGVVVSYFGPASSLQTLRAEYESVLSSIAVGE